MSSEGRFIVAGGQVFGEKYIKHIGFEENSCKITLANTRYPSYAAGNINYRYSDEARDVEYSEKLDSTFCSDLQKHFGLSK